MDTKHLARSHEIGTKIGLIHQKRMKTALARMAQVGAAAIAMLLVQTAALATLIAVPLMLGLV